MGMEIALIPAAMFIMGIGMMIYKIGRAHV